MSPLENWILQVTSIPREELCSKYGDWDDIEKLIETEVLGPLRRPDEDNAVRPKHRRVSPETLQQFASHIRDLTCEHDFWNALLFQFPEPIPDIIAHDLIDRDISVHILGHTRQSDAIMWRLAPLVEEALLTFADNMYLTSRYSAEDFRRLLNSVPYHDWVLNSLSHCTATSLEKRDVFLEFARQHPNWEKFESTLGDRIDHINTPGDAPWRYIGYDLDAAEDENLTETQGLNFVKWGDPQILKSLAGNLNATPTVLQAICDHCLAELPTAPEPNRKHISGFVQILQIAAQNPNTPLDTLHELTHLKHHAGSRRVRENAAENLQARLGIFDDSMS